MNDRQTRARAIDGFITAAHWFVATVGDIGETQWGEPGLGEWTIRELVGHTGRACSTVEEYLRSASPDDRPAPPPDADDDPVGAAGAYFAHTHGAPQLHADIAARGREAGIALGPDPVQAVSTVATRAVAVVTAAPAGAVFATRFGVVPFASYLYTRIVELVVHTVDICDWCAMTPQVPDPAGRAALAVLVETARRSGATADVLRALGGRGSPPAGFSVFG